MKTYITILIALLPCLVIAGWQKVTTKSNGTTPVVIASAPGSGSNRVVTAVGGIKFSNGWTNEISGSINEVNGTDTNLIESFKLGTNVMYINEWVHILNSTTNSIEIVFDYALSNSIPVYTHYRDEAQ